jgi:sugar porter (SP) family MFS transporter
MENMEKETGEASEAGEKYRVHKVWITAFHAALGSFIFSYNIGVFTPCQPCVSATLGWGDKKDTYVALASALVPLGALFGSLGSGFLAKYIGRRQNLIIADIIIIFASIITVIPFTATFGIGRFLSGIGIGNYSMLCPLYINEITPTKISGKIGSLVMLFGCMGSLSAFSLALTLPTGNYENDPMNYLWMGMFLFQGVVALVQLSLFFIMFPHETPHWLLDKGLKEEALESLAYIYRRSYAEELLEKMQNVSRVTDESQEDNNEQYTYKQIFSCAKGTTKAMRVGILMSVIQQFAGINAIMSYATTLFENFGGGVFIARVFTALSATVKLMSVFILMPLIDNVGRKKMVIIGCIGMGISLGAMGIFSVIDIYYVFPFLVIEGYLAFFVTSIGPICWVYSGEILPSKAMSICTGVNWFCAFLIVLFFPFAVDGIGLNYTFWIFAFFNIAGAGYFGIDMIETKGLTKKEIRAIFSKEN